MAATEALADLMGLGLANDLVLTRPRTSNFAVKLMELANLAETVCLYDRVVLVEYYNFFPQRFKLPRILLNEGVFVQMSVKEALRRMVERTKELEEGHASLLERFLKRVLGWKVQVARDEGLPYGRFEVVPLSSLTNSLLLDTPRNLRHFHEDYVRRVAKDYQVMNEVHMDLTSFHAWAEEALGVPLASGVLLAKYYVRTVRIVESFGWYASLLRIYRLFREGEAKRDEWLNMEIGVRPLVLPPVLAVVLNRVIRPGEIPYAILELRDELKSLRERFREYMDFLHEPCVSRGKKLREASKLSSSFLEFLRPYKSLDISKIRMIVDGVDGAALREMLTPELRVTENLTDGELVKALGKVSIPFTFIGRWWKRRRISAFYSLREEFQNIDDYSCLMRRVWGSTPKPEDMDSLARCSAPFEELWRYRLGEQPAKNAKE